MVSYTVDAVDKALGLLTLVAKFPGLGVTELAKRSGNTKARAFRLLGTLEESGYVQREHGAATYTLGYKALFIGAAASKQINLASIGERHLQVLGQRCNESVLIRLRDGLESVCIARFESTHAVRVHTDIGDRQPLYVDASGKLLLAFAPQEVQKAVLESEIPRSKPEASITPTKLRKDLKNILDAGIASSLGEHTADTISVAAPIQNAAGEVIAALSISGPKTRISENDVPKFIELVTEGARSLSQALGFAI